MREINHEEDKEMEDFVDITRVESRYLSQDELLEFIHETTYNITEQLFDSLGGKIDVQVITVTQWMTVERYYDEVKDRIIEKPVPVDRIHNTKFFETSARNNIFPACDSIVESLKKQYLMHSEGSCLSFMKGYVMKLRYRINRSFQKTERSKKYKGGSYINHFDVPYFTNKVRTNCLTRMNNYNTNKEPTYIYNIVNPNDNLCFLRYIILIKFLSVVRQREYLNNFHIPQILPIVNPENLGSFIPFIPFVRYPTDTANQYSEEILKRHFPGLKHEEALVKVKLDYMTKEYIIDCTKFMCWLNTTETFPVNADDAHLIEQFENLNDITINIYSLDKEAYEPDCIKKLHEIWTAKYMTKKLAMEINTSSHLDLMLIRKVIGYEQKNKIDAKVPIYQAIIYYS